MLTGASIGPHRPEGHIPLSLPSGFFTQEARLRVVTAQSNHHQPMVLMHCHPSPQVVAHRNPVTGSLPLAFIFPALESRTSRPYSTNHNPPKEGAVSRVQSERMSDESSIVGRIQNALMSATNKVVVTAANINFDFSMIKYEAPPEYRGISGALSSTRRQEAETGELHITARRLGALSMASALPPRA